MSFIRVRLRNTQRSLSLVERPQATSVIVGDDQVYTFDRSGRLVTVFQRGVFYRRGLDHRLLLKQRGAERQWQVELLDPARADSTYEEFFRTLHAVREELGGSAAELIASPAPGGTVADAARKLDAILAVGPEALAEDGRRFGDVYTPVAVLPPDRYLALVLQVTQGCSHNQCRFCALYRDVPFRVKSAQELEEHMDRVAALFGAGLSLRQSIFLGDANALVIEPGRLLGFLRRITSRFDSRHPVAGFRPRGLYSFVDSFHTGFDDPAVWAAYRRAGLTGVYLGVESGDDELLAAMNKPASRASTLRAVTALKGAGLQVGVIFIVGLGGAPRAAAHLRETSALLESLPLDRHDLVFFSPYVSEPEAPMPEAFEPLLTPGAIDRQRRQLMDVIRARPRDARPRAAVYSLREFIY